MFNYKKLISDTFIFALGNLGSNLIGFILVPFYTYYLSTSDYGLIDIVTTTNSLLLPIITLSVYESVLRLTMDRNSNINKVFSNCFFITIVGISLIFTILIFAVQFFNVKSPLISFVVMIVSINAFQSLLAQFARAIGKIRIYSINGILSTLIIAISNILFLKYFRLGIAGYFYSVILGGICSIIFLWLTIKPIKYMNFKFVSFLEIQKILNYSTPLIPNSISLWLTNAANRYFILFFLGTSANGLFAVASKIPNILGIISAIFYQAWQLSAINQYQSKNNSLIYTSVFKNFSMLLFLGASAIIMIIKPFMGKFVSESYYDAWKFIPFLLLGTVLSSFSSFLGTTYIAAKETKGVLMTTIYSALISIILNYILIPIFGINGAGLSMVISYFVLWLIRVIDTKKYVNISVNKYNIGLNISIYITQIVCLNLINNNVLSLVLQILLFLLLCIINRDFFIGLKNILLVFFNK